MLAFVALTVLATACRRQPPLARALEVRGTVERGDHDTWTRAQADTEFFGGDTLRTGAASGARVALLAGGAIRVGEKAVVRFQYGAPDGQPSPAIAVELGSAEVEDTPAPVSVLTSLGPARIERGARVRVRSDTQAVNLEVLVGRAVMLEGQREVPIDAGQGIRIRLGSAEIQRFAVKFGETVLEPAPPSGAKEASDEVARADAAPPATGDTAATAAAATALRRDDDDVSADHQGSGRADITLNAGESATLHDGHPQAAVRLRIAGLCPDEAILELAGRGRHRERFPAARAVILRLRAGRQSYSVRCAGDERGAAPRATGVLSLRRDTGNVPLARRLPTNVIEADGRRYTVLFQTRLPQLMLVWPSAPKEAAPLELHLDAGDGDRVIERATPTRPLPAGTVQEGTYTFWYQTASGKQSPRTTLSVRFDNVAPTAQFFRTPAGGTPSAEGVIPIDGVTVEGAKVSVGEQPLAVDAHGRFRVEATPLDGDDAVGVRLEHPRTGIHYYVRRRAGAR